MVDEIKHTLPHVLVSQALHNSGAMSTDFTSCKSVSPGLLGE